jgi:hypothetical protein
MKKLKKVREADLPKLEALLTQPRSAQMLLDLTMNKQDVITEDNIEEILEMMRRTTAEEVKQASKQEMDKLKRKARGDVEKEREHREKLAESLATKSSELEGARSLLERKERADVDMMQRWAEDAAKFHGRAIRGEQLLLMLLAALLAGAGWMLNTNTVPAYAGITAWVAAALTFVFAIAPVIPGFPNVLGRWIVWLRDRRFRRRVQDAGREDLLESHHVDWKSLSVHKR